MCILLMCKHVWVHVCTCCEVASEHITAFPETIATIARRCQPAEVTAAVRSCSEMERFYIQYVQTESRRERQTETEWGRGVWQISVTMCLTATSSLLFYPAPLVEYSHESEGGIACSQNGEWHHYRYKTTVTWNWSQRIWQLTSPHLW